MSQGPSPEPKLASVVCLLPTEVPHLLAFVESLITNTPGEYYDVVFVDHDAPAEVRKVVQSFSGDVTVVNSSAANPVEALVAGAAQATGRFRLAFGGGVPAFRNDWLPEGLGRFNQSPLGYVLMDATTGMASVALAAEQFQNGAAQRLITDLLGETLDPDASPVLAGMGETGIADLETLRNAAMGGSASVGRLPEPAAERLRERLAMEEERRQLLRARDGRDVCWTEGEEADEPLVTIRIPTYNRGQLIVDRAINSALAQTYARTEILVVGDNCDAATAEAVLSVKDPKVRFINLPARGVYPTEARQRWYVAGVKPVNVAIDLAAGDWIAPLDDDDEFTPDHVEVLLTQAKQRRLEMVWSKAETERGDGWEIVGRSPLEHNHITHGSVMYSAGLRFMKMSSTCWLFDQEADWNFWKRMRAIGVRMGFVDHITFRHYAEAPQRQTQ